MTNERYWGVKVVSAVYIQKTLAYIYAREKFG
jgi:hypothetical protein